MHEPLVSVEIMVVARLLPLALAVHCMLDSGDEASKVIDLANHKPTERNPLTMAQSDLSANASH